MQYMLFEYL